MMKTMRQSCLESFCKYDTYIYGSADSGILCEYDPCQVGSMRNEPI